MLIDIQINEQFQDPVMALLVSTIGNGIGVARVAEGVYRIGHFSFDHFIKSAGHDFEQWPDFEKKREYLSAYGVCDDYEQVIEYLDLEESHRKFVMSITPIIKSEQDSDGGWRWHKWGPYIGTHEPTTEYLYDEPIIEQVLVFHVYEILE